MFHILVVDDDKHTRMLLRAILEEAGYTVTTANNGEEALDVLLLSLWIIYLLKCVVKSHPRIRF